MSKIEWTEATWNPVIGCSRVSEGCRHCYAETMAGRLARMGRPEYEGLTTGTGAKTRWTGEVLGLPERLALPLAWRKPRRVFVNSMSDLLHPEVPFEFIAAVYGVMAAAPQHTFQVLTKRPERALEFFEWFRARTNAYLGWDAVPRMTNGDMVMDRWMRLVEDPLPNVHLGVSIEDQRTADERVPLLLQCPAAVRWVSAEPLLGAVHLSEYLRAGGLRWLVVGGESGPGARPMHPDWARSLRDQCQAAGVPFLFKQWGAWMPLCAMTDEDSATLYRDASPYPDDYPEDLRDRVPVHPVAVMGPEGVRAEGWPAIARTDGAWAPGAMEVHRVGKAKAVRLLDGRTWDEYPGGAR